jgi:nitrite reductase/ring-hydroxylating ferredoxin subunit
METAMSHSPTWNPVLESILNRGAYLIVSRFEAQEEVLSKIHALLHEGVAALQGADALRVIEQRGLQALHEVLPPEQIGALRDYVMPKVRPDLLTLAARIGRRLLGMTEEFFVDDYTILRINYPYLAALQAPSFAENPGIGRTGGANGATRTIDPVYDPKGFHNHEPPPAWAHGPHQDTWTGHSRFGVNLWWAVDDVPEECSMVFYPETFGRPFAPDPRSLYLKAGQPLPKPTKMALRRGEMLIFNPEMLHGTHLNTANRTRLALSTRLNASRPTFDPNCFYAREFWHSSTNLEADRYDQILRFPRADNLRSDADPIPAPIETHPPATRIKSSGVGWQPVCESTRVGAGQKAVLRSEGHDDILLMRGERSLHAVQSRCAHLDIGLADGFHDDEKIWCPVHAVAFSLEDGRSSCPALTLRTYAVREEQGTVWLRFEPEE